MIGAIPPLPNTSSWRGAQLKHRDNFTFTLHLIYEGRLKSSWIGGSAPLLCLSLHNSGLLPPVHELLKWPLYVRRVLLNKADVNRFRLRFYSVK
jgi:hypothetical protein